MKKKKTSRYIIIGIIILVVLIIIASKTGLIGKEYVIEIYTEKVEKRSIVETVSANGKVQPEIEVKISPDVSGEITELYIKEGDKVKKGDILAKINPDIYISNLDRIEASLNQQKANLSNAKARLAQVDAQFYAADVNYKRNKQLKEQGAISASEFEAIESQYLVAKAEVEATKQTILASEFSVKSAEAALKEAKDNLTKTSIFAPVDGSISKLSHEKGERVAGASQFSGGTEIIRIADLNKMEVKVDVNENDIIRISIGDTADIEIDAYLNQKFKGVVTSIANSANTSATLSIDQVTNFEVKIKILQESYVHLKKDNDENFYPFRPGMSASVDIMTTKLYDVLSVPIQAVTTREDSATAQKSSKPPMPQSEGEANTVKEQKKSGPVKEVVFVYKDGTVAMRTVKTGIQDSNFIYIVEGLNEGEEVVAGPYRAVSKNLKDGIKVNKVEKDKIQFDK